MRFQQRLNETAPSVFRRGLPLTSLFRIVEQSSPDQLAAQRAERQRREEAPDAA